MSIAEVAEQEFELFHRFVKEKLKAEPNVKVSLIRFREYQAKLDALREELEPACQAIERGESIPWDAEGILDAAHERLKTKSLI